MRTDFKWYANSSSVVSRFYASCDTQNVHAIGDHANEVVLDIFEDILRKPGADVNTWRPRIEHAQIFQPSDFERIGRLGGSSYHL